uniref:Uncharacterized protein n=1 Tax=Gorilla gorilla gorilla TaxID=9595 RepID=G3SEZ6_GORGO
MYPESTTGSPARLSLRQTGSPGMIYSTRYGSPKRQLQFYRQRGERAGQARVTPPCSLGRRARDASKSAGAGCHLQAQACVQSSTQALQTTQGRAPLKAPPPLAS